MTVRVGSELSGRLGATSENSNHCLLRSLECRINKCLAVEDCTRELSIKIRNSIWACVPPTSFGVTQDRDL